MLETYEKSLAEDYKLLYKQRGMTLSRSLSPGATGRLRAIQQYLKTRKNFDYKKSRESWKERQAVVF